MVRGSLLSMTICTLCADLKEWEPCTTFSGGICGNMRAYPTRGRRRCGTAVVRARRLASQCSVQLLQCLQSPLCGEETMNSPRISKGSRCSGCLSVILISSSSSWRRRSKSIVFCWNGFPWFPTHSRLGSFLSFCAAARANFYLRAVSPDLTDQFVAAHDDGVWECLCRTLKISPLAEHGSNRHFVRGWAGTSQCSQDPTCSPLGKLGRRVEDGAGASSRCG